MTASWLWRAVDALLALPAASTDALARARARFIAALALFGVATSVVLAPMSAATGGTLLAGLVAAGLCSALLLLLRRGRWVGLAAHTLIATITFMGLGMATLAPTPGSPSLGWLLILGLTPLFVPRRATAALVVVGTLAVAVAVAPAPPEAPSVAPLGGILGIIIGGAAMVVFMLSTHRHAVDELATAHAEQLRHKAEIDAAAAALGAHADVFVGALVAIGHGVRTPLNGVIGVAGMLDAESPDDGTRSELAETTATARFILQLLETTLQLARATARGGGDSEPTDVPMTLRASVSHLQRAAPRAVVRVTSDLTAVPRLATVDGPTLRTLVDQLLQGLVRVGAVEIRLGAVAREGALAVQLCGVGAAPERVGERDPMGLGVARALARVVGGDVVARGEPQGLSVELTLPSRRVTLPGAADPP